MSRPPPLWRLARRLEEAYARRPPQPTAESLPAYAWDDVVAGRRRLATAERRGWRRAARLEHLRLLRALDDLLTALRSYRVGLPPQRPPRGPTAGEFYAELSAAQAEFGPLGRDDDELYVTTDEITLAGIELGSFEIRLRLGRLEQSEPYRIVALEPRPARSSPETTHPHVYCERICLGEGKAAVAAALAEGRLGDLFQLIHRVLRTYGEASPYVPLERWHGVPCGDCAATLDEDESYLCRECEASVCGECVRICRGCDGCACHDCAGSCPGCEETACSRCLQACESCGEEFCPACREEGVCDGCRREREEELEAARRAADDDESAAEPPLHADRLGQAALLAGPRSRRNRRLRNLGGR